MVARAYELISHANRIKMIRLQAFGRELSLLHKQILLCGDLLRSQIMQVRTERDLRSLSASISLRVGEGWMGEREAGRGGKGHCFATAYHRPSGLIVALVPRQMM